MLLYCGKKAYSAFRLNQLIRDVQQQNPAIRNVSAHYLYLLDSPVLPEAQAAKLTAIIDPTSKPWTSSSGRLLVFITPRFGTISPWSTKATNILHTCGLTTIARIEHGIEYQLTIDPQQDSANTIHSILPLLHDRMTETCSLRVDELAYLFSQPEPASPGVIALMQQGIEALAEANQRLGGALSWQEMQYLHRHYTALQRDPTEAELMMFAQINSEHCRHKVFNATWTIAGQQQSKSLFAMIRNTHARMNEGVLSAYTDNAAIITGHCTEVLLADPVKYSYSYQQESAHIVIKVETHNHPTAIAPFAGAATGAGGEIRDEGATGIGGKPKAGLVGFSVSDLHIPGFPQPWERFVGYPSHVADSLKIMLHGPVGAASFNNEFGRPNLAGYFRTYQYIESQEDHAIQVRGYHKPIMIAGGMGQIRPQALKKSTLPVGAKLIVLGGPAMLIGLGGGAASSLFAGDSHTELDFASVQRSNPEMERRCQEVINACIALGEHSPIISIHDVGAGGLANALTELVQASGKGALINMDAIPTADSSLNPMQLWCNEAQERYVLAIQAADLPLFKKIAERERCPFAVVGETHDAHVIKLYDRQSGEMPVSLSLNVLFGEASALHKDIARTLEQSRLALHRDLPLAELIRWVLQLPVVADKRFLITIGDRTVTGLVARDQMVGPWQVAVADVAVTASGYNAYSGEAMAIGERAPLALINAPASARMAIAEAITNVLAADVQYLSDIKLSANWMAASNYAEEDLNLFTAVQAVGMELCPALGICIPVGKDSLSMQMKWQQDDCHYTVASPMSLVVSAFAPVQDIRRTLTPLLLNDLPTELLLIDLGAGKNRLGASALAQVTHQLGNETPDVDTAKLLQFFSAMKLLRAQDLLLAYHDRSDGGLLATVCEMAFASHVGITLELDPLGGDPVASLFSEELGAVIQYACQDKKAVFELLEQAGLLQCCHAIGKINDTDQVVIQHQHVTIFAESRVILHRLWSETSYQMQSLRDNPMCALQEYDVLLDPTDPGLSSTLTFPLPVTPPAILSAKPKVAILREQGVNGHMEMAAAFTRAGFEAIDVHMSDILAGHIQLLSFQGLVACGGFSYGDVLGAGRGWANSILFNSAVREQFTTFFHAPHVFVLGVCNGCQMLSNLKELIPGAHSWPRFFHNESAQFEARLSLVKVRPSASIFFRGMEESIIPVAVSHAEGRAEFEQTHHMQEVLDQHLVPLQFVDNYGEVTQKYPANPNGSPLGITALTNQDGRFTIMMPHGERVFRNVQLSWRPKQWHTENSPWFQLFVNARNWVR